MTNIEAIAQTRDVTSKITAASLEDIFNSTEAEIRDSCLSKMAGNNKLFPQGWYDPPPGGISILWAQKPFERLKFNTLRDSKFWPSDVSRFGAETVGIVYLSSVDRETNMIGDIALTIYNGADERVQEHIRTTYKVIHAVAERAEVGMKFSDLYAEAMNLLGVQSKEIRWMATSHDPMKINLGHTIPGSFGKKITSKDFKEIKAFIRSKRIYINENENFQIPPTCAFTVEARLVDAQNSDLPNVLFHFIVTLSEGKKEILTNFDDIFSNIGMSYIV